MLRRLTLVLSLLSTITNISSSPFQLTDKYVEEFKHGIENLEKVVQEYNYKEDNIDWNSHNETKALAAAEDFDFVIIGAGGSGAVIANRLSEVPEWKILILEAGGEETQYTQIPSYYTKLQNTPYNWGYVTTPQKHWCKGMVENRCAIAGGKILGGSTSINGMVFTRGNAKDYDEWADLGNDGWCYDDVLPYFKKLEDIGIDNFDHKYHNHGGPFHIEYPQYSTHLVEDALKAGKELDLETIDYNGKDQIGISQTQINSKHGVRVSTNEAYLKPAKKRQNLTIKPLSHVMKILIAPHTKQATGVEYLHDGKLFVANAKKEVIVSAGTINTPQILMLSGIGPKETLEKLEIPLVKDLSVGKHFKDHLGFFGLDFLYNDTEAVKEDNNDVVVDYLKNGKGPLTATGIAAIAFAKTDTSKNTSPKQPDIEILFVPKKFSSDSKFNPYRFNSDVFDKLWKPHEGKRGLNVGVMVAHPKSHGTVTLKDKDPLHKPLVDPNALSDPDGHDLKTLLAGVRKAIALSKTETMQKIGLQVNEIPVPGCEGYKFDSDDYWKCAIQHLSISLRHVTGTARMGPATDKDSVVDSKLKVYGVAKLRVADNSVIPVTISGHTMAAAIMIGEKAADLIKADWK